jgi:isoleucyl-tRNA synthetase
MLGHDSRYVPGWDCHGLPIEWKIEEQYREKGRDKDAVDVVEFRQECRRFAEHWIDVQREEFKRLGVTGNWDDPYLTMDFHAERVIAEEFMKFLMNGTLYQGSKPVMWSPVEKTALAEAEVEYHDRQTDAVWVPFRVVPKSEKMALLDAEPTAFNESLHALTESDLDTRQGGDLDHDALDPAAEPAICFGPRDQLRPLRGHGPARGMLGADRRPLLLADALAEEALAAMRLEPSMYRRLRDVTAESWATCPAPIRCAAPRARAASGTFDVPSSRAIT